MSGDATFGDDGGRPLGGVPGCVAFCGGSLPKISWRAGMPDKAERGRGETTGVAHLISRGDHP